MIMKTLKQKLIKFNKIDKNFNKKVLIKNKQVQKLPRKRRKHLNISLKLGFKMKDKKNFILLYKWIIIINTVKFLKNKLKVKKK